MVLSHVYSTSLSFWPLNLGILEQTSLEMVFLLYTFILEPHSLTLQPQQPGDGIFIRLLHLHCYPALLKAGILKQTSVNMVVDSHIIV
jgi:hypothetical protein